MSYITKRTIKRTIASVKVTIPVIIICMVLGLSQTAFATGTFQVTAGVNVRESASTSAKSLTTVPQGSSVEVADHDPAGWSRVSVGSITGYIRSDYLKLNIGDSPATFQVTAGVHIRETGSTSARSLTTIPMGTNVAVHDHDPAGWSKVSADGVTGYIRSDFLKHTGTGSSSSGNASGTSGTTGGTGQYKTNAKVNFRAEPSAEAEVLKELANGTGVDVLENEANGWSKVSYSDADGSITGYIRSDLLTPSGNENSETVMEKLQTVGNVNMRTGPSTSKDVIRTLSKGTSVDIIEKGADGWSKVIHNGDTGYIKYDLLTSDPQGEPETVRYIKGDNVNLRAKDTTASSIIKTLKNNTAVTVKADLASGWSSVTVDDSAGYIRSDYLSPTSTADGNKVAGIMRVATPSGANVRASASTTADKVTDAVPYGTDVTVLSHESNGWSKVNVNGKTGYIKSDLLSSSSAKVELVKMSEITHLLPNRENIRVVDVRTGISYNIKIFSKGIHADYETATKADTDIMFSIRNGARSWAARPLWVYVGDRVFAAATHSMPHSVTWISDNGLDGHLCLHFYNTENDNISYRDDLRKSVQEAYDKRPQ